MTALDWTPPPPQRPSGTAWLVGAIFASQIVSGLAFVAVDPTVRAALLGSHPASLHIDGSALAVGLLAEWLVLLIASYWWAAYDRQTTRWDSVRDALGWTTCTRRALWWAAALAAVVIAIGDGGDALASALGAGSSTTSASVIGGAAGSGGVTLILLGGLAAPIVEETFFRGALLSALSRRYSLRTAVTISAAIFAVLHLGGLGVVGVFNIVVVGASGVALALLRARTGSLAPGTAAHIAINLVGLIAVKA